MVFQRLGTYLFALLLVGSVCSSQDRSTPSGLPDPAKRYLAEKGEVYFQFRISSRQELNRLTWIISLDKVVGDTVYAYANQEEFGRFQKLGYQYTVLPHPGDVDQVRMAADWKEKQTWDAYPTYETYEAMMYQFAVDYPQRCRVVEAGTSVQGRRILFARISDNVDTEEDEPEVMYTSTIHGDETAGFILMLRLIDYLLSRYETDPQVRNIVDNIDLWINPLANPDGTYFAGNHTVAGARRNNANRVDLNRNFPDPQYGQHPDGRAWQPETIAMMDLGQSRHFVLSANFHAGAEVVNYPWDTWERLHADDDWFQLISRQYADTCQANGPAGYMDDLNDGITNGYQWYSIHGGRQDYVNYFNFCRELTIEMSETKLLPADLLPAYWDYNRDSFLVFLEQALSGVRGIVTDLEANPLASRVEVVGHDFDNSEVWTDSACGNYHRLLSPGTYTLKFSSPGHYSEIVSGVMVNSGPPTLLNIQLEGIAKGDINADRAIDIRDVIRCLRMVLGLEPVDAQLADLNSDGLVDISDALLILAQALNLAPA